MDVLKMIARMNRFDMKKLLSLFNESCDVAGLSDEERKVVFDAQAEYISAITGHVDGVKLSQAQFRNALFSVPESGQVPKIVIRKMGESGRILSKYKNTDAILESASTAIFKQYFAGGVFKK